MDALVHWLHLMAAAVWVGGNLAVALVVQPALRAVLPPERRLPVYRLIGRRFSALQWACWAVLLATGLQKLWGLRTTPSVFAGPFGAILAVKLCLVGAMVALSLAHARVWGPRLLALRPGAPGFAETAARMAFWGRVNAGLMAVIVGCGALLRYHPW
jgi:putative copper export protein